MNTFITTFIIVFYLWVAIWYGMWMESKIKNLWISVPISYGIMWLIGAYFIQPVLDILK